MLYMHLNMYNESDRARNVEDDDIYLILPHEFLFPKLVIFPAL